jgi:hypothetical protein
MGEKMTESPTYIPINEIKIESDKEDLRGLAEKWKVKHERINHEDHKRILLLIANVCVTFGSFLLFITRIINIEIDLIIIFGMLAFCLTYNHLIHRRIQRIIWEGYEQ